MQDVVIPLGVIITSLVLVQDVVIPVDVIITS